MEKKQETTKIYKSEVATVDIYIIAIVGTIVLVAAEHSNGSTRLIPFLARTS